MHRSGTSLTTRLLADCGLCTGHRLSINAESVFFRRYNERMYRRVGASWSRIRGICDAMSAPEFVDTWHRSIVRDLFHRRRIRRFFSPPLRERIAAGECPAWGWKDPRTTVTFPVWLRVFPAARWLYVRRNGIDVAISLHRRAVKHNQLWKRVSPVHNFSARVLTFRHCLELWAEHIECYRQHRHMMPADRVLEIDYEALLADPVSVLERIMAFSGYPVSRETLQSVSERINTRRLDNSRFVNQYRSEIEPLLEHPLLKSLGYADQTRAYFTD